MDAQVLLRHVYHCNSGEPCPACRAASTIAGVGSSVPAPRTASSGLLEAWAEIQPTAPPLAACFVCERLTPAHDLELATGHMICSACLNLMRTQELVRDLERMIERSICGCDTRGGI